MWLVTTDKLCLPEEIGRRLLIIINWCTAAVSDRCSPAVKENSSYKLSGKWVMYLTMVETICPRPCGVNQLQSAYSEFNNFLKPRAFCFRLVPPVVCSSHCPPRDNIGLPAGHLLHECRPAHCRAGESILVPTWTRPKGGQVHYTDAVAGASTDRRRSSAL